MGIRRVTGSSPCLNLVMKVERGLHKNASGARKLICALNRMSVKLQSKLGGWICRSKGYKFYKGKRPQSRRLTASLGFNNKLSISAMEVETFGRLRRRGTDKINVLAPYIVRLFAAMMEKAAILACWKVAKITPLYKEGSVLDPGNYRMLAVSGTL
eukprot:1162152-Pelagomonas_calceolata.AAC.8